MKVEQGPLAGVIVVTPTVRRDSRGSFRESWQRDRYAAAGLPSEWVQGNVSTSSKGVLRGLHFQWPRPQGKLVTVLAGSVLDVVVDVRSGSPTFGQGATLELTDENARQIYVPEGFAHGFLVLSPHAIVHYKCTDYYDPAAEQTLRWNDPALALRWPVDVPTLSAKDAAGRCLNEFSAHELPVFGATA